MFRKLTMGQIERYLFSNSVVLNFIAQDRHILDSINLLDNAWAGVIFKKYKVWLNHEQKWYLFLSLCAKYEIETEEVLLELNERLVDEMARAWAISHPAQEIQFQSLETAKHTDLPILAIYEYIMTSPELHRGDRIKKMLVLVHDWYESKSIAELLKVRTKIIKMHRGG